jgi:ABC-2 type transport system permease protein
VIRVLPFQAIYYTPLAILTDPALSTAAYLSMLLVQAFWVAVLFGLSRVLFLRARRTITVNGG